MDIVIMVLDLIHLHVFHWQMVNEVKEFIFGEDNSSSRNAANRKKEILVFGEDPADGLDGTTITAEAEFSISITKSRKSICVSLHYNANNSFLHANGVNISHFKANILK